MHAIEKILKSKVGPKRKFAWINSARKKIQLTESIATAYEKIAKAASLKMGQRVMVHDHMPSELQGNTCPCHRPVP